MERIEKIRSIINNWRQKFKTGDGEGQKQSILPHVRPIENL